MSSEENVGSDSLRSDSGADTSRSTRCEIGEDITFQIYNEQLEPIAEQEGPSGIERCNDGSYHRFAQVACEVKFAYDSLCDEDLAAQSGCEAPEVCYQDDCCYNHCPCMRPCQTDDDCGDGFACLCGFSRNRVQRCIPASCRTDADCGGFRCGLVYDWYTGLIKSLACHTAEDECEGPRDCEQSTEDGEPGCAHLEPGNWFCVNYIFGCD